MEPGPRKAHLVGSLAASDGRQAMELSLEVLGDQLDGLPDGETGERSRWIIHLLEALRNHPDLAVKKDGDWSSYRQCLIFKLKPGHRLRSQTLRFGYADAFSESWPVFEELRSRAGRPHLAFQQGVPGDLDLAISVFGRRGFVHRRPFTEATLREIRAIHQLAHGDVVFQIEVPFALVFVAKKRRLQPVMAGFMARGIAKLGRRSPPGTRFGIHLCLGDMNHKALLRMQDAQPLVLLANAIVRHWPTSASLEYIHAPFAAAAVPPSTDERWYAPLQHLSLPTSIRFIAGFAHEDQSLEEQRRILDMIERHFRRNVDISTSCGLGRRSPEDARAAMERIAELVRNEHER